MKVRRQSDKEPQKVPFAQVETGEAFFLFNVGLLIKILGFKGVLLGQGFGPGTIHELRPEDEVIKVEAEVVYEILYKEKD
jgi:hypothetical protein